MLSVIEFQRRWRAASKSLTEIAAYSQHFLDLCDLFGVPGPAEADPSGVDYAFQKGTIKSTGKKGFADVWKRGAFAFEYKGHHKNLDDAYDQLLRYLDDLENPPILVVCDLDRFVIRTHFTNTPTVTYTFDIDGLSEPANLDVLRAVFTDPNRLKPRTTTAIVTEEAARRFGELARSLHSRGFAPDDVAHFLVQLLFCLFAEDAGLLPRRLFTELLTFSAKQPDRFPSQIASLLTAMRDGGDFALQSVERFNGGLFVDVDPIPLSGEELKSLVDASRLDWGAVEPAIFGTLFERGLDPGQRSALGAHYTGRADIERVVEPVLMVPLRRRWAVVRAEADPLKLRWDSAKSPGASTTARNSFARKIQDFQAELAAVRVLDPACGSGNFLYVALARLMDLEKEVITYAAVNGLPAPFPTVGPRQLHGIEINPYAHALAQVVVWIGFLQWRISNGFTGRRDPVLDPLETIEHRDALLTRNADGSVSEATWPAADAVVGNPPFLGDKRMRTELGDDYVDVLRHTYGDQVPGGADFVCYWFEKAREQIASGQLERAGLLSTNSIRGGVNRRVLDRIKQTGDIFMAWDDEPWVLNGADVRISIVGFDDGTETERTVDGVEVAEVFSDLTGFLDLTKAHLLKENADLSFNGVTPIGPFDVEESVARHWLELPLNPNGRPNADVVRPYVNARDVVQQSRHRWIVDFGVTMSEAEAALYEAPFEFLREHVRPQRLTNRRATYGERWWQHGEARPRMRALLANKDRYLVTPRVSKHRVFAWLDRSVLPGNKLIAFARDDDYFFGVVQGRAHEVWSLKTGAWQGVGNDPVYQNSWSFETFPLPWSPGSEPVSDPCHTAIADAARRLDEQRVFWLNPPEISEVEARKRTLTNLYNLRPTWLLNAHVDLDRAVWAAYGWPTDEVPADVPEDTILGRLLALNLDRAAIQSAPLDHSFVDRGD